MTFLAPLHFVAAKPEDFDYFYALRKETMMPHFLRAGKEWPEEEELALHRERFDTHTLRMIYNGDARIGFVAVRPVDDAFDIELFCIEPAHQNQGIGTKVLEMIIAEPALLGCKLILDVLHGNPAARLYERMGFVRTPQIHDKLAFYARPPTPAHAQDFTPPPPTLR
jgi:ribosomal protein S18 acetylase RimI-like enzyme